MCVSSYVSYVSMCVSMYPMYPCVYLAMYPMYSCVYLAMSLCIYLQFADRRRIHMFFSDQGTTGVSGKSVDASPGPEPWRERSDDHFSL